MSESVRVGRQRCDLRGTTKSPDQIRMRIPQQMSATLNEAAMAGNLSEVRMRLDLGEDVNQKLFPR